MSLRLLCGLVGLLAVLCATRAFDNPAVQDDVQAEPAILRLGRSHNYFLLWCHKEKGNIPNAGLVKASSSTQQL